MIENYAFKDLFESKHSILKPIRKLKRTSVNPLKTTIEGDERVAVYNLSNSLLKSPVQKNIKKVFTNKVVEDYVKTLKSKIVLYECRNCSVYGTEYKRGNYVLLPQSSNEQPVFAKITKVLCCEKFCHLYYKDTTNEYCSKSDLFMIKEKNTFGIIKTDHLADYHVLHGYKVGEAQLVSISLRNFFLEHL